MILDKNLVFDSAATFSTTAASTNIVDLLNARDIGEGSECIPLKVLVLVTTTFLSSGSGTVNVQFQGAADDGTGNPDSYLTYAESGAIAKGSLVAGAKVWNVDVPEVLIQRLGAGSPLPRFLRLNYVVGTATMSAGAVTSAIVLTRGNESIQYPSGFTVAN